MYIFEEGKVSTDKKVEKNRQNHKINFEKQANNIFKFTLLNILNKI